MRDHQVIVNSLRDGEILVEESAATSPMIGTLAITNERILFGRRSAFLGRTSLREVELRDVAYARSEGRRLAGERVVELTAGTRTRFSGISSSDDAHLLAHTIHRDRSRLRAGG